jgi:hypothetical protein
MVVDQYQMLVGPYQMTVGQYLEVVVPWLLGSFLAEEDLILGGILLHLARLDSSEGLG